jgi:hypothetical protein
MYARGAKERKYVRQLLGGLVREVLDSVEMDLETDPAIVSGLDWCRLQGNEALTGATSIGRSTECRSMLKRAGPASNLPGSQMSMQLGLCLMPRLGPCSSEVRSFFRKGLA